MTQCVDRYMALIRLTNTIQKVSQPSVRYYKRSFCPCLSTISYSPVNPNLDTFLPLLTTHLTTDSQEYVPSFNPIALKDSALSTHKPIEVKGPGGKATIIHAQYNTPISMYSQDAIMDAIAGQAQARGNDLR